MSRTTLLYNATLVDGSGAPPFLGELRIDDGILTALGKPGTFPRNNAECIDAKQAVVAPGFIDVHSHSDTSIFHYPSCLSKISQGVTTEIVGNCGTSDAILPQELNGFSWKDVESYGEAVNALKPALNIATLVGHGSARLAVIGKENRPATAEQCRQMCTMTRQALEQGALGLSSGLIYIPGKFADTAELSALASQLKGTGKPYATHIRGEAETLLGAVEEAIQIAQEGDQILEISHIKTERPANWWKFDPLMEIIDKGRSLGLAITADRYPYTYCGTGLRWSLPEPYNSIPDIVPYLKAHREQWEDIKRCWQGPRYPRWERLVFCFSTNLEQAPYFGCDFKTISEKMGCSPEDAYLEILSGSDFSKAMTGNLSEENLERFYQMPWIMPGSDGYSLEQDYRLMHSHPRSFGTFNRFFRMVSKNFSLQETIRRMTSLPASVFNLKKRGLLKPGYIADFVLLDPATMDAEQDFKEPHKLGTGILKTFVSGICSYDANDKTVVGKAGRFIRG